VSWTSVKWWVCFYIIWKIIVMTKRNFLWWNEDKIKLTMVSAIEGVPSQSRDVPFNNLIFQQKILTMSHYNKCPSLITKDHRPGSDFMCISPLQYQEVEEVLDSWWRGEEWLQYLYKVVRATIWRDYMEDQIKHHTRGPKHVMIATKSTQISLGCQQSEFQGSSEIAKMQH